MSSNNSASGNQRRNSAIDDLIPYPIMVEEPLGRDLLGNLKKLLNKKPMLG